MDELNLVRELLAPPPSASPEVAAEARRRLAQRMGGPARRQRARWAAGITGVAAAGFAGALAVTLAGSGTVPAVRGGLASGHPAHKTSGHPAHRTSGGLITSERPFGVLAGRPAGTYLTALAGRVAQATPTTGRYWCTTTITAQLDPIGPSGQELTPSGQGEQPSPVSDYRYSIFARQAAEDCQAVNGNSTSNVGGYYQDFGATPATAADAAAWRADGSPAWHGWYDGHPLIPARAGARQRLGGKPGEEPWGAGTALPSDPARLRQTLMAGLPAPSDPMVRETERVSGETWAQFRARYLFQQATVLLLDPLTPAVRAAAYQVLANVPGVHMTAGITDPDGRSGTALWMGPAEDPGDITLVDPVTGMLLGYEWLASKPAGVYATGTLTQYTLFEYPGWNSKPASLKY